MSSAVVSTSAALGRPFVFDGEEVPAERTRSGGNRREQAEAQESPIERLQSALQNQQSKIPPASLTAASRLTLRPAPEMVSSGVPAIDGLTGGLPRGCVTEICGPASSGRTTLVLSALAAATRRGEFCVVVDANDALDPYSAAAAGVDLERLLWVRCGDEPPAKSRDQQRRRASFAREAEEGDENSSQGAFDFERGSWPSSSRPSSSRPSCSQPSWQRLEQVLRATDLLLESGGFGMIVLDLGDLPAEAARRVPLTTWFRFRRAIEHTPTILLAVEQRPIAGSCSSLLLQLGSASEPAEGRKEISRMEILRTSRGEQCDFSFAPTQLAPTHAQLLSGLDITAELIRSRLDRKPAGSVMFTSKTAWAG